MFLTISLLAKKVKSKHIMVCMESVVSGHRTNMIRERLGEKMEIIRFDPLIQQDSIYKELKKVKSMSAKYKPITRPFRPVSRFAIQ
ncbi:39S ribosomal protein L33, mitochondrial [Homalodisca vitripennis]|uniref:39S ribosomal protein L33, mitochondrial n=1 Tax=Homalodisca vitripennis TaxID=197043 RepID=UPI001EEA96C1|nr:39S ribosomal protein L33, mitochondrial [Homalodisca vitripennis]